MLFVHFLSIQRMLQFSFIFSQFEKYINHDVFFYRHDEFIMSIRQRQQKRSCTQQITIKWPLQRQRCENVYSYIVIAVDVLCTTIFQTYDIHRFKLLVRALRRKSVVSYNRTFIWTWTRHVNNATLLTQTISFPRLNSIKY